MEHIIESLQQVGNWKQLMRKSCKNNGLKTTLANQLTILKLKYIGIKLNKSYQSIGERVGTIWIENQLKTYHWILIALSGLRNLTIQNLTERQWELLGEIFLHKKRSFLKFQAKRLICTKLKNTHWTSEQSNLLKSIVLESGEDSNQWNDIARKMFEISEERIFRTGKHCRERWLNYLDPSKQRGQWTHEEDQFIVTKVESQGKKWSQYAAYLKRTQHCVKNRFNSLLIKQKKLTPHYKKEPRLLSELKRKFNSSDFQEEEHSQMGVEESKEIINQLIKQTSKQPQIVMKTEVEIQRSEVKIELIEQDENVEIVRQTDPVPQFDILQYARSQEEFHTIPTIKQFGIYSPYWNYSPSNGTPNAIFGSPSPIPFYINSNFTNYFNRFTAELHNLSMPQEDNQ